MAPHRERRSAKDIGSESPASEAAKKQNIAGARGAPRASQTPGMDDQPPQSSNRRSAKHEHKPEMRKHLEPERDPAQQGRGPARAQTLKNRPGMQGFGGAGGGTGNAGGAEGAAARGEPREGHTRHGRQHVPGKREGERD